MKSILVSNEQLPLLEGAYVQSKRLGLEHKNATRPRHAGYWRSRITLWKIFVASVCLGLVFGSIIRHQLRVSSNEDAFGRKHADHDRKTTSNYSCIPGQACWPSAGEWRIFNQSIDGRLRSTVPWASPCFHDSLSELCQHVVKSYSNGSARTYQYGSMEFLDWEACGQSQCSLDSMQPSSPVSGTCSLGRLSTYHIEARTARDISMTLDFIRKHGIRISIKNTGHDYFGRSNAANSLAIWTHNMKDLQYHETFQPQGCRKSYNNVAEVGAGVQAREAWTFFEPLDMLVTVGAVGSVGIAGGFGQGGGHGPLGPKYGLMVDQAIEFDVVTADGNMRTINECSDPSLFWAMRGGGGGNYAVLTSYKFQLHPAVPINVYSFQAKFTEPKNISESRMHRDIVTALALNQTFFAEHGMAGYNFLLKDHIVMLQVMPSADTVALKSVTSQWHDFLSGLSGLTVTENNYFTFKKFSEWHTFTETPAISRNGPVGLGIMEAGRFIPRDLFASSESIQQLVDAVLAAMQFSLANKGGGGAQIYSTGPHNHPDNSKTGVNPEWRKALWHIIMGSAWTSTTPPEARTQIQKTVSASVQPLKALTPGGGCYINEGDWLEEDWQQTFFGDNYNRLLDVKRRYDPTGLFNCWKCVGWTGYDE